MVGFLPQVPLSGRPVCPVGGLVEAEPEEYPDEDSESDDDETVEYEDQPPQNNRHLHYVLLGVARCTYGKGADPPLSLPLLAVGVVRDLGSLSAVCGWS